jgi:hypothetical protein
MGFEGRKSPWVTFFQHQAGMALSLSGAKRMGPE